MTTESLDKTKIKESIENIRKALRAYKEEVDKKNKKTMPANNDQAAEAGGAVIRRNGLFNDNSFAQNIKALFEQAEQKLKALEDAVNGALGIDENTIRQILVPILEAKIKEIEQQVKAEYLPTYLHEIYEVIKTLLGKLIVWLSTPLPGDQQQVHRFAQTLSSTHSSVVYEFKNMEKTLFSRNTKDRNPATRGFVNEGMNEIESKLLETIGGLQQQLQVMQQKIESMQGGADEHDKQLTERIETLEKEDKEKVKKITSLETELASVKTTAEAAKGTANLAATKEELAGVKTTAESAKSTADLAATKTALSELNTTVKTVETTANAAATQVDLASVKTTAEAAKSTADLAATKKEFSALSITVDAVKMTADAAATQVAFSELSGIVNHATTGLAKKADKTTVETLSAVVNDKSTGLEATTSIATAAKTTANAAATKVELAGVKTIAETAKNTANLAATETALNKLSAKVGTVETTANAAATKEELAAVKTTAEAAKNTADLAATQVAFSALSGKVTAAEESLTTKADQSDLTAGLEKKADKTTVDTLSAVVNDKVTGLAATATIATTANTKADAAATKEALGKLNTTVDVVGVAVERIRHNFFYRMRDYGDAKKQEPNDTHGLGQAVHSQMEVLEAIEDAVTGDKKAKVTEAIEKLRKQNGASFFDEAAWLVPTSYRTEEQAKTEKEFLEKYPKP